MEAHFSLHAKIDFRAVFEIQKNKERKVLFIKFLLLLKKKSNEKKYVIMSTYGVHYYQEGVKLTGSTNTGWWGCLFYCNLSTIVQGCY